LFAAKTPVYTRRARVRDAFTLASVARKAVYLLVSRQPAASASSTEQNQRVPLAICILIWEYQRLVGL
jgi:hypothetical protein